MTSIDLFKLNEKQISELALKLINNKQYNMWLSVIRNKKAVINDNDQYVDNSENKALKEANTDRINP